VKLALIGCGRMGTTVEALAPGRDHTVVAWVDSTSQREGLGMTAMLASGAEVAVDFTTADAVVDNVRAATGVGLDVVVGTTGWYDRLAEVAAIVDESGKGLIYAPNFSLGMQLFIRLARQATRLAERVGDYDVHLAEAHHRHKADHPSGTAVRLAQALVDELSTKDRWSAELPEGPMDHSVMQVSVVRAGEEPGTHTVGLDGPHDRIELRHRARSRAGFARGALAAAEWIRGRPGLYTLDDMMAERFGPEGG
jgi:4-hydroxy-tetrahydrodipicolinate reductase